MNAEIQKIQPDFFNEAAYTEALKRVENTLSARYISIDGAKLLVSTMRQNTDMFRLSLGTPHFISTINLLERLTRTKRTPSNSELVDSVPDFAQAVLQDLNSHVQQDPDTYLMPSYKLARSFAQMRDPDLISIATGIFTTNLDSLLEAGELSNRDAEDVIKHLIATANPQQIRTLVRSAITPESALSRRFTKPIDSILNLSILGPNISERPARMAAVLDEITGEQANRVINAWDDSEGKRKDRSKGSESVYFENFSIVCQLEKQRPGITKLLIEKYGIFSFARYPLDLLIDQYDTRDEKDVSYGILIAARNDHNGIMLSMKEDIGFAHKQAKAEGYGLKVFEVDDENLDNFPQAVNNSSHDHGQISYMLLLAHELDTKLSNLDWERSAFVSSAIIGLISCSTGRREGTAQMLSSAVRDIDVHAPDHDCHLREQGILFEKMDRELNLKVLFGYGEGNKVTEEDIFYAMRSRTGGKYNIRNNAINIYDVPTRVYRNGELVRDYAK